MAAKLSAIVLNFNGRGYTERCLESVLGQTMRPDEILVVDNASTDSSAEEIERRFASVKLIRNERNLGFAGGMNVGLRLAAGDFLVLLNQDVELRPGCLEALERALKRDETIGIVGAKLLYPDGRTIQHAGGWLEYPLALAQHHGYGEPDQGQHDQAREVEYANGAVLALRRAVLEGVGYFDEGFFPAYYEETDLCWRAREAGFRVLYVPEAVAIHYEASSIGKDSERYYRYYHCGRVRLVLKHYSRQQFWEDFLPAERARLRAVVSQAERRGLAGAYLESLLGLPTLPLGEGEEPMSEESRRELAGALVRLRQEAFRRGEGTGLRGEGQGSSLSPLPSPLSPTDDELWAKARVQERPFTSRVPLIGPGIAWVRELWNSVSTKWYVRPILQQQVEFNEAVARRLEEIDERLVASDRDMALLAREVARLGGLIRRWDKRLEALEEALERRRQQEDPAGGERE